MMLNRYFVFLIASGIAIFDQLSKLIISRTLSFGEEVQVIKYLVSFTKVYNTGAAFSIFEDKTWLLALFSVFVTIAIIYYFLVKVYSLPAILIIAWGFILGGTVGNMIDRIRFGFVVDFIRFDFVHFPIFNIADMAINIGAFLIFLHIIRTSFLLKKKA